MYQWGSYQGVCLLPAGRPCLVFSGFSSFSACSSLNPVTITPNLDGVESEEVLELEVRLVDLTRAGACRVLQLKLSLDRLAVLPLPGAPQLQLPEVASLAPAARHQLALLVEGGEGEAGGAAVRQLDLLVPQGEGSLGQGVDQDLEELLGHGRLELEGREEGGDEVDEYLGLLGGPGVSDGHSVLDGGGILLVTQGRHNNYTHLQVRRCRSMILKIHLVFMNHLYHVSWNFPCLFKTVYHKAIRHNKH